MNVTELFIILFCIFVCCLRDVESGCTGDVTICPQTCDCAYSGTLVTVDCNKRRLSAIPSLLPEITSVFKISGNNLSIIRHDDLAGCNALDTLDMSYNIIEQIPQDAFRDLNSLKRLHLHHNKIEFQRNTVPNGTFDPLVKLEELAIQSNHWKLMSHYRYDIIANKPRLRSLSLDAPLANVSLGPQFSQLSSLQTLHVSGGVSYLGNDTLSVLSKLSIHDFALTNSELSYIDILAFSHLPHIMYLDLSNNPHLGLGKNLYQAWYSLRNSRIRSLRLRAVVKQFDYIAYTLAYDFFDHLNETSLEELYLDVNGLVKIHPKFRFVLPHLRKLSLSYNRFFDYVAKILLDLYYMKNLYYLDLSNQSKYPTAKFDNPGDQSLGNREDGNIPVFFPPNIKYVNMSATFPAAYKMINDLIFFSIAGQIDIIDVSQNKMNAFNGKIIMQPRHSIEIQHMDISGCGLKHISANMYTPEMVVHTTDLSENNLGQEVSVDVRGHYLKQIGMVQGKVINIASNNIRFLPADFFLQVDTLEKVILRDNSFSVWHTTIKHIVNITILDLSLNLIPYLESVACSEFDEIAEKRPFTLNLTGNPLECECYSLHFLRWMLTTKVNVFNRKTYQCHKYGELVELSNLTAIVQEMTIECSSKTWVLVAGISSVLLVIIVAASVAVFRHRWDIRYCCLKMKRQGQEYEAMTDTRDFLFDAFVAYHQNELSWVIHQLLPNLETCRDPMKLCIHHRNWLPGPTIEENISRSVEESKRTLAILSESFLQSGWCEFEMEMARLRGFEEGKQLIVVVALENIPMNKMNRTLANLRKTNTWLDWYDYDNAQRDHFWELLRQSLR